MDAAERAERARAEREACEAYGIPFCEHHEREHSQTPEGRWMCESCGWEAQRIIDRGAA